MEIFYDEEGYAGPPPKEKPPWSKMTKEEKEYWKQVGHLHEDKPHEPYVLPDVKTPKEQQRWVTQNTIWNKDSRYCTGRCGSQCEGGHCRDSGCPSLKISCAVPIRSPNEPTSATITSPPWKLQKQHPTTSDAPNIIQNPIPVHKPSSPIDSIIQGIGNLLQGKTIVGGNSILPQEQPIEVPVGYARPITKKKIPQNVPYDTWAPQMWTEFNNLGANFKSSQDFASQVHNLIGQIPCPECKTDGELYVKTNPPESVTSKAAAQNWVKAYHSHVDSVAKGWGEFSSGEETLDRYKIKHKTSGICTIDGVSYWCHDLVPPAHGGPGDRATIGPGGTFIPQKKGHWQIPSQRIGIAYGEFSGEETLDKPKNPKWVKWQDPEIKKVIKRDRLGVYTKPLGVDSSMQPYYIPNKNVEEATRSAQRQQRIGIAYGRDDPWYSTMWAELHLMADHFNPYTFADQVRHQIDQIPCPPCSTHSLEFMAEHPPEQVKTRDQAMYYMCKLHNMASSYAGNGLVDCALDPEGYGYSSGHRDYDNDFFYGGGSKGGGGGGQHGGGKGGGRRGGHGHGGQGGQQGGRGGGRRGHHHGQQQQQQSGYATPSKAYCDKHPNDSVCFTSEHKPWQYNPQKDISKGDLVKIGGQWCYRPDVSEADGVKYCVRPLSTNELPLGTAYPVMPRIHPLPTQSKAKPSKLRNPSDKELDTSAPHLTNPSSTGRMRIAIA